MKKNVISLALLIIIFLVSLFSLKLFFAICMSLFAVLSLRELLNIRPKDKRTPIEMEILSYVLVVLIVMNNYDQYNQYYFLDYRIIASLIFLDLIPLVIPGIRSKYTLMNALYLMASTLFIGSSFNLIVQFRSYNLDYVTYIFLIAFFTDLFGFITGRLIGKHKLTSISPKKTVEGALGGLLMGTFVPTLFFISTLIDGQPIYVIVIITMFLSIMGQVGDLVFSCIKREFGKKDFSNVVIGNGGILDTIDSLVFVTLGLLLCLSIL